MQQSGDSRSSHVHRSFSLVSRSLILAWWLHANAAAKPFLLQEPYLYTLWLAGGSEASGMAFLATHETRGSAFWSSKVNAGYCHGWSSMDINRELQARCSRNMKDPNVLVFAQFAGSPVSGSFPIGHGNQTLDSIPQLFNHIRGYTCSGTQPANSQAAHVYPIQR